MKADTHDMIARLVAFDTVSRNSNLPLIEYVEGYLSKHGIASHRVSSPDGKKANLFATVGPNVEGGVVLSGHTDVVPVDGQPWDTDPFTATLKNGRLYGRGTCDMKAFSAIALAMVPSMLEKNLRRPIHLALTYDEEVGCVGAPFLIDKLSTAIAKPRGVIVGEPTSMRPIVAHKGLTILRTQIIGHEAHSSQIQRGVSAVMTAARLVGFIDGMMAENKAAADPHSPFIPPFSTLHVGVIHGGTAVNIISRECSFMWDIRVVPGDNWHSYLDRFQAYCQTLLPAMKAIAPDASIETEVLGDSPFLKDEGGSAQALIFDLLGHSNGEVVPYGAEAGQYQERGFSTVLCGPGSIDQAHQPNEYIDVSQVEACEAFFEKLVHQLAA